MLNEIFADMLKLVQILVLPAMGVMYAALKRQINNQRDMKDVKRYIRLICDKVGIDCTLESN